MIIAFTTIPSILLILPSKLPKLLISRSKDPYDSSCVLAHALVGCVAKNFKLIIIVNALATKANFMMGKTHIFYLFYL
jgi:hypothetical protein